MFPGLCLGDSSSRWFRRATAMKARCSGRSFSGRLRRLGSGRWTAALVEHQKSDKSRGHDEVADDDCQCKVIHSFNTPSLSRITPKDTLNCGLNLKASRFVWVLHAESGSRFVLAQFVLADGCEKSIDQFLGARSVALIGVNSLSARIESRWLIAKTVRRPRLAH